MNLRHYQGSHKEDTRYFGGRYDPYSMSQFDNRVHRNEVNRDFPTLSCDFSGSSSSFSHDFHEHKRDHFSSDGYGRVKNLEHDRTELLMKLENLKIQLSNSNDVREKTRETMNNQLYGYNSYTQQGSDNSRRVHTQPFVTDEFIVDHDNRNYNHGHNLYMRNIYPRNDIRNESASSYRYLGSFNKQPYHHSGSNPNKFVSRAPQCSCFQCYDNLKNQSRAPHLADHSQIYHINRMQNNHFTSISGLHGGAPFFSCPGCFHLLKLPKISSSATKKQQKLRCGVCSELISISLKKNGIVIKAHKQLKEMSTDGDVGDIDASTENFKNLEDDLIFNLRDKFSINTLESENVGIKGPLSTSSSFSEEEFNLEGLIIPRKNDSPIRKSSKFAESPTPIPHSSHDVALFEEENQPIINEDEESYFQGFLKKSLKELLRVGSTGGVNVFVNGEPLSDQVVKKAEKLAGPIHPGDYWYDYRAGFWGVMGLPCHGIIPPSIEEFNYPMPTNCGAGNTGVYVNGRELHERDLDLLANRGLPITSDKFYIIDISGRVVDEYTGEELGNLGKLAPTVEKLKHGFGMRPRAIAQ